MFCVILLQKSCFLTFCVNESVTLFCENRKINAGKIFLAYLDSSWVWV